jgi:hypothetical protein
MNYGDNQKYDCACERHHLAGSALLFRPTALQNCIGDDCADGSHSSEPYEEQGVHD